MKKIFLTLFLLSSITYSFGQVTGGAALIALDEIDAMITEQLQSIDNIATNAIGNGGNMLLSISSRLRKDINETIGNTDKKLRENQLNLYNQLLSLSEEFNTAISDNLAQVDGIAVRISQAANDIFFKKREPNIFSYKTQTFIKGFDSDYTLEINGNSFDRSYDVFIELNGKKISASQSNHTQLIFKIDSSDIKSVSPNKNYGVGSITFKWKKGVFKRKKVSQENFIIPIIPLEIGEVQAFYEQELPEKRMFDRQSYKCSCSTRGPGASGRRKKSSTAFNVLPTDGRRIDPNTLQIANWSQRHGGGKHFEHVTEQQIKGKITCRSQSRPFGGGGHSTLTFTYQEYDIIYKNHKFDTETEEITAINPILFDLPNPVDDKRPSLNRVDIKTYDGQTFTLLPNVSNKYFSLKINPVTDDVSVEWRK